jgi:dihydroxyacetone kinase-like protein
MMAAFVYGSVAAAIAAAADAAAEGAEATKDMVAAKGRSSRLGDRSIGHVDPGAASAATAASARPPNRMS